jgi:hypothetical protein
MRHVEDNGAHSVEPTSGAGHRNASATAAGTPPAAGAAIDLRKPTVTPGTLPEVDAPQVRQQ